jgi:hypothetical protein
MGILFSDVMTRLEDRVSDLRSIKGVADFTTLLKQNALPQQTPAAHVVPTSIRGGKPDAAAGVFTQPTTEAIAIILTLRPNDQAGERALEQVDVIIGSVIAAIAGWCPDDELGVFQLERGTVLSMSAGTLIYQIDFSIADQLRITS